MTHISELATRAQRTADLFPKYPREQALVYACEEVAERECPARLLSPTEAEAVIGQICLAEDIDAPFVEFGGRRSGCIAWTLHDARTVGFKGRSTTMHSVVHEIAHLITGHDLHDAAFRHELVRLARAHLGIEYAALLHALFGRMGLQQSPWDA